MKVLKNLYKPIKDFKKGRYDIAPMVNRLPDIYKQVEPPPLAKKIVKHDDVFGDSKIVKNKSNGSGKKKKGKNKRRKRS
jgi:hypothetical protein|tara:strand:+ start:863 stop:1099 length:237 start_codon:yes stop_codon:yes gene_type:complete